MRGPTTPVFMGPRLRGDDTSKSSSEQIPMLYVVILLAAAAVAYAFARPYLIERSPRWAKFCAWLDPIAVKLWRDSRTILVARLCWVPSGLLTLHDLVLPLLGVVDWNP